MPSTAAQQLEAEARAAHERARQAGHIWEDEAHDGDHWRARRRARWEALVPAIIGDPRIEHFPPPIAEELNGWAERILTGGRTALILTGPVGVGKSHAAYAALRPIVGADRTVTAGHVGALLDQLRPDLTGTRSAAATMHRLITADVLLLDDLGEERPTDWTVERLGLLIHERHAALRPLVITTNLPGDGLAEYLEPHIGERATSRLADDNLTLRLTGADRRRTTA